MTCCNKHRVRAELHCEIGQQLVCAESRLVWSADHRPEAVARMLAEAILQFPAHLAHMRVVAKRVDALDHFIKTTAHQCAALATKTERREYRAQLEREMGADELVQFDQIMAAEWQRLRSR